jgi:hypothetical protein
MKKQWIVGCVVLIVALSLGFSACPVGDPGLSNTKWERKDDSWGGTGKTYKLEFTTDSAKVNGKNFDCTASFNQIKIGDHSGTYVVVMNNLGLDGFSDSWGYSDILNGAWTKQ